jgi:carbonic anhydrase/acetyltransferase-like protein (isoleucine patch superfamily)
MGAPAKVIKQLNEEQIEAIKQNAARYVQLKDAYLLQLL